MALVMAQIGIIGWLELRSIYWRRKTPQTVINQYCYLALLKNPRAPLAVTFEHHLNAWYRDDPALQAQWAHIGRTCQAV
jgi:hypothetical protein